MKEQLSQNGQRNREDRVIVFDTTLRDGEQTPGVNLNVSEKTEIAKLLESLGVDIIEAGFPAASPGDFLAVQQVAKTVGCGVAALCRSSRADTQRGWDAVKLAAKPRLHLFLATSDIHMKHKLRMERPEVATRVAEAVSFARGLCDDIEFSCEDASRTDPDFLYEILEIALASGATTLNIPDTVGFSAPAEFGRLIKGVRDNVRGIERATISVHCHNDLGLAVSNTLAAIENGARQIETTVNGLGERAGNCSMEEIVMTLTTRGSLFGVGHGIDTTKIYRTSSRVASLTKVPIPVCKAIVGANAFAHESGIHQHGVLANPMTYEIMTPQSIGKTESTMVLGKLSGRHAFAARLESMGHTLSQDRLDTAFASFKELADKKKEITDDDLDALASNLAGVPERYTLDTFQIQSGNRMRSMASLTLAVEGGETVTEAATGDGPIDAAYNAASRIVGGDWRLESYAIKAVTGGMDALGEVTVRVRHRDMTHVGSGLSTDVIEASILAYINAVNRAMAREDRDGQAQASGYSLEPAFA